jgi:hypothetical protein
VIVGWGFGGLALGPDQQAVDSVGRHLEVCAVVEPSRLDNTVTARWRRRLVGVRPDERRHWRTRTAYYAAVSRLLTDGVPDPAWSDVIDAVRPKGSRSTFY